jgi:hypothetical protein
VVVANLLKADWYPYVYCRDNRVFFNPLSDFLDAGFFLPKRVSSSDLAAKRKKVTLDHEPQNF